jgi:hypothetical protein
MPGPDCPHPLQPGSEPSPLAANIDAEDTGESWVALEQAVPRLQGIEVDFSGRVGGAYVFDEGSGAHDIAHGAPLDDQDAPDS